MCTNLNRSLGLELCIGCNSVWYIYIYIYIILIFLIVIDVSLPPKQRPTAKPAPQTTDLHLWETKCRPLLLPPRFPFSFFQNKDLRPNPLPKPPFSTFVTWNQFFLMIGKSTNLSVTKRKGELNHADGSLSSFLPKIKLNGLWSLFFFTL